MRRSVPTVEPDPIKNDQNKQKQKRSASGRRLALHVSTSCRSSAPLTLQGEIKALILCCYGCDDSDEFPVKCENIKVQEDQRENVVLGLIL